MRVLHSPPLTSGTFPGPPVPFTPSPEAGPHLPTRFHTHAGPGNSRPWVWPASPHLRQWCPGMQAPGGAEEVLLLGSHWSYRVPTVPTCRDLINQTHRSPIFFLFHILLSHILRNAEHTPHWGTAIGEVSLQTPRPSHWGSSTESEAPGRCAGLGPGRVGGEDRQVPGCPAAKSNSLHLASASPWYRKRELCVPRVWGCLRGLRWKAVKRDNHWHSLPLPPGTVYLDHAGATLFPQSQLTSFTKDLMENVYGNPHSQNSSSKLTHDTVEQVRYRILAHFHTSPEDYTVIFTAGSTAALKLVAEAFPWVPPGPESSGSHFCYLTDSHTSVVGMREVVAAMNITSIPVRPEDMWLAEEQDATAASDPDGQPLHLFCYPAQSNFSGTRYPLSWIEEVKSGRMCPVGGPGKWFVLLDAAAYVGTSPLDLSVHRADFLPLSFYKIFGFPTGLGALLVNSRSAPLLRKTYFGGGTAAAYLAEEDFYIPKESVAERFEDGTISFLDVIALKHGFDVLERLTGGMENIRQHTFTLAQYTYTALSTLRYPNGAPVVQIYSDSEFSSPEVQGPVISFNVLDDNGNIIGYSQVDKMASLHNIHVRTGCFCNTGACQRHLGISDEMVKKHLQAGHVCGDDVDLIDGQPTGSVRISFGYMSTLEDAQAFLRFIIATRLRPSHGQPLPLVMPGEAGALPAESEAQKAVPATRARRSPSLQEDASPDSRVWDNSPTTVDAVSLRPPLLETTRTQQTPSEKAAGIPDGGLGSHIVTNLFLYPIKSCAAFEVTRWPLGNQGLLYDRSWMVVNHNGVCLSQKQEPRLCLIQPFIDLQRRIMVIKAQGMEPIAVPLEENSKPAQICQSKVCADRVNTYDCGEKISSWLSKFFGRPYHLIRQSSDFQRNARKKRGKDQSARTTATLSLVNEAQYLLINRSSVLELQQQLSTRDENGKEELFPVNNLISRFRANIITNGTRAFEEEKWDEISVGSLHFQTSLAPAFCHSTQSSIPADSASFSVAVSLPCYKSTCSQGTCPVMDCWVVW
ncbi:molybdenum cofactor sulfurase isoform X2 [Delphinapterus leucas]|uniref:Molybdenum cofactor sulfurase n=1 Tax=Delphinapterus leucas TaxID=9749 RepID=A0A7F8K8L9_DELLE|nr:molybdenum cofactor sulfurase isoform X2 [Delphinapterus leucas]